MSPLTLLQCAVTVQYSTVQYSTVQYSTVQYSTVQYSTVQYSTVQYSTVQYSTVQYSTVQYSTVQYSTVQYSTVQYSTVVQWAAHSRPSDGSCLLLCLVGRETEPGPPAKPRHPFCKALSPSVDQGRRACPSLHPGLAPGLRGGARRGGQTRGYGTAALPETSICASGRSVFPLPVGVGGQLLPEAAGCGQNFCWGLGSSMAGVYWPNADGAAGDLPGPCDAPWAPGGRLYIVLHTHSSRFVGRLRHETVLAQRAKCNVPGGGKDWLCVFVGGVCTEQFGCFCGTRLTTFVLGSWNLRSSTFVFSFGVFRRIPKVYPPQSCRGFP